MFWLFIFMLTFGDRIDCANPVNRQAALNHGLYGWHTYVPGLSNDSAQATTGGNTGIVSHDLTKLPGGVCKSDIAGVGDVRARPARERCGAAA